MSELNLPPLAFNSCAQVTPRVFSFRCLGYVLRIFCVLQFQALPPSLYPLLYLYGVDLGAMRSVGRIRLNKEKPISLYSIDVSQPIATTTTSVSDRRQNNN